MRRSEPYVSKNSIGSRLLRATGPYHGLVYERLAMQIARDRTALLVMDFQNDVVDMLAEKAPPLLERTAGLIAAARGVSVPVIYVVVGFRDGYPEVGTRNQTFAKARLSGRFVNTSAADVHDAVKPIGNEPMVVKRRVGAFWGTDMEVILRAQGIESLILAGISTSGVVLSTTRAAADADYKLFIASDCCMDNDDEVHRVLMTKVFPRQATVTTASDVIAALKS